MLADEASLLVDERLMSAVGAFHSFGFGAVCDIFLQGAFHTVLPRVDALALQLQGADELDDVLQRHAVAQHAGNQLGIVPVFLVEFLRESLDGGLVTLLVLELEVVAFVALFVHVLDDAAFHDAFGLVSASSPVNEFTVAEVILISTILFKNSLAIST